MKDFRDKKDPSFNRKESGVKPEKSRAKKPFSNPPSGIFRGITRKNGTTKPGKFF